MAAGSTLQPHEAACSPLSRSESPEWSSCAQLALSEWVFRFQLAVLETHPQTHPKVRLRGDLVVSSPSYVAGENERRCSIRTHLLKRKAGEAAKGSRVVGC